MPFGDVSGERMPKKGIMQYYEKFSSVLEKARKSPWTRVAFWGGVAWLSYQQMFIWGVALFVVYEGWAEECISSKSVEYYEKAFDRLDVSSHIVGSRSDSKQFWFRFPFLNDKFPRS